MVSFVVLMALLSSISSMTMAGPRMYAKMASDGYLPLWFAKASAPGWACVWLQGGLAISMLWLPLSNSSSPTWALRWASALP